MRKRRSKGRPTLESPPKASKQASSCHGTQRRGTERQGEGEKVDAVLVSNNRVATILRLEIRILDITPMTSRLLLNITKCLFFAFLLGAHPANSQESATPQLTKDEKFGVLRFALRLNYVHPPNASVEEGVYKIVLENPNRLAGISSLSLEEAAGKKLQDRTISPAKAATSFFVRLTPGKHVLRIGSKKEWGVEIEVKAKAK
ncbi:MAG TPA: hypothetical protein PLZ95_20455 [Bryobacteraceae bacterium]|nr:hypothetical protein [Bryobacteraceae bacterium]